jgi:hypothetical protein
MQRPEIRRSVTKRKTKTSIRPPKRRMVVLALLISLCGIAIVASGALLSSSVPKAAAAAQSSDISPEAMAQIAALLQEKMNRTGTQQKMDTQLLYELKMDRGQAIADGIRSLDTDVPVTDDGKAVVDITAAVSDGLLSQLKGNGAEIISVQKSSVRASVPIGSLETIAALSDVKFVQPKQDSMTSRISRSKASAGSVSDSDFTGRANRVQTMLGAALQGGETNVAGSIPPTGVGSVTTEGDATHRAFSARGTFHADGTGIKVGVLSNGVTNLAASQALGDLGPVTVLPGQAGTGDEGTAMLEIVHDIAPGAQLFFATANNGISSFAQNIRDLRTAGCDIIIDDVFYFVETPFQDGTAGPTNTNGGAVIQAVNDVTDAGAMYFSSAGNSGNLDDGTSGVWEGDFVDGGPVVNPILPFEGQGRLHSFGSQTFNVLNASGGSVNNLYWSDPLGGSDNDYDLFRLNAAGTSVLAASLNVQNGTQDPYEQVGAGAAGNRLVIVQFAGAARFLHLNTNRGRLSIATAGQTHGHAAALNAFGCAATPANLPFGTPPNPVGPFPNPFGPTNASELFSSDGPRRIFFQANGTPYTPGDFSATGGIVRQKPDITAADGTSVTGVGGFGSPFYGTSAAAPHAGAIAALLKSANPAFTPAQIRAALISSAIDIESPGVDRDTGAGIVMAYNAFQALGVAGTADVEFGAVNANEDPGDGNGTIDAGEGAKVDIQLRNLGVNDATGVTATLTTSTPGVTIQLPNTSLYPNLPVGGSALNSSPFRFTLPSNAPCPLLVNFTLTVNYTGGPSPKVLNFSIQTGRQFTVSSTLDATAPSLPAGFSSAITGTQTGRLNRFAPASSCGVNKPNPGVFDAVAGRRFDAYTFTACSDSCVTVNTTNTVNSIGLFTVVYNGAFNPDSVATNYLADPGSSGPGVPFSFNVVSGQTYTIVVSEVNVGGGLGLNYSVNILGCIVDCQTPNQAPVAKVKNVTVSADASCQANASIDDGSFDPDGDPVTITQSPAGPYPLGTTNVMLTITDSKGATAQASATVTVVDTTGPSITGASATPNSLAPPNHSMVPITVAYSTTDNCSAVSSVLTVSSNEPVNGDGDGDRAPDWVIVDNHHVQLRAERSGGGNGRIYTIQIDASDAAGNHTLKTVTVIVPH